MSKINKAPVWLPPEFPVEGRLSLTPQQVHENIRLQDALEREYHDALCRAAGFRVPQRCCKTLHISLFFDGTGNNLNNDLYLSTVPHPTNIARLFRAAIGAGHAGGTGHSGQAGGLTDAPGTGHGQYYKYYMPGVGTPFPEVNDLDYSTSGLAFARGGEDRVNWGLLMIIDALRRMLKLPRLDNTELLEAVQFMATWSGTEWISGRSNRHRVFHQQLKAIERPLSLAVQAPAPGHPKLLGIKLYVFGFSRGAAAARAFVNWLDELLTPGEAEPTLTVGGSKLPISVDYLGLLDTVASVGIADAVPGADGHMGWGDGTQELPKGALVKRCLHIVASHEQRLSFPLDSIRRPDGTYPANSIEVIYPGMHSDQGGGYPPGDQGKAVTTSAVERDGFLLSQIALQDLFIDAYSAGAPLKVPNDSLPANFRKEGWRVLSPKQSDEFRVSSVLAMRFNGWREATLLKAQGARQPSPDDEALYLPVLSTVPLEEALRAQMDWLTAWRIDRYAFESLKGTNFYNVASDSHATPQARAKAESERNKKQTAVEKRRSLQQYLERRGQPKMPLEPGVKDFDPDKSQTQLREAAEEFGKIYRDLESDPYLVFIKRARWVYAPAFIAYWLNAPTIEQILAEQARMKAGGRAKVSLLFPPRLGQRNHASETDRGSVDEARNCDEPEGLLRALFDDQVHDSRAWFLHATLNDEFLGKSVAAGREPLGSYFTERMVFFGAANRREVVVVPLTDESVDRRGALASNDPSQVPTRAEERERIRREIAEMWDAYPDQTGGIKNGQRIRLFKGNGSHTRGNSRLWMLVFNRRGKHHRGC